MQTNTPPRAEFLPISKLRPFENHPFWVKDDAEMDQLVFSVLTQGLLTPIVVRETDTEEYEVISGHRRLRACQKAGIETVPALIYSMDRDAAIIALVDSNLHREHLLPSEKAFAYKMKMEAESRQGQRNDLTSDQVGPKLTASTISEDSASQVKRYIRLTYLIPEILQMVDEKKIAMTPAVELSYLTESQQRDLLETMESEDCTPSLSQSQQLKKLSQSGVLNMDRILELMQQPKANQEEKLRFDLKDIRRYFPKNYTTERIQKTILQLLEKFERNWKRRSLDER
ncbi:MAG: ParB/RepB/Spo0J family partition protein [Clostridiales bacterium]|nr:ParB/RepB/Spo0J family partition protein [Clostridiales bacterium]